MKNSKTKIQKTEIQKDAVLKVHFEIRGTSNWTTKELKESGFKVKEIHERVRQYIEEQVELLIEDKMYYGIHIYQVDATNK
jgi:predicted metalloprotease